MDSAGPEAEISWGGHFWGWGHGVLTEEPQQRPHLYVGDHKEKADWVGRVPLSDGFMLLGTTWEKTGAPLCPTAGMGVRGQPCPLEASNQGVSSPVSSEQRLLEVWVPGGSLCSQRSS